MDIAMLLTVAIAAYALVRAVISMLRARKRSWIMAVLRLAITAVSAVAAIPVTQTLADLLAEYGYTLLSVSLEGGVMDALTQVPVGAEGMRVLAALLVSPLLYLLVFMVLRFLLSILAWILEKCLPFLRRRKGKLLSLPLGALNGALIAVVTLIPLCGYLTLCGHLLHTFVEGGMTDTTLVREKVMKPFGLTEKDLENLADGLEDHPVVKEIYGTVGGPVYSALTTATLDTADTHGIRVEMNLERELTGLLVTAGHAMDAVEAFDKDTYTADDKAALLATGDSFFDSEWVRLLATDTLVALSESWLENKPFAGMERPAADAALNPTLNRLLEILAAENAETLEADIHVILDVFGDLKINGLMEKDADYTAMVQRMGESGLLTDMLATLEANDRLKVLADEIKALSIRLVSNMLGVDKLQSGEYADMMGNVATSLTDALSMSEAEQDALILNAVKNDFAEKGYNVPDEVALKMSHQMIDELGADGEITEEELTNYLVNHADEGFDIAGDVEIPDSQP